MMMMVMLLIMVVMVVVVLMMMLMVMVMKEVKGGGGLLLHSTEIKNTDIDRGKSYVSNLAISNSIEDILSDHGDTQRLTSPYQYTYYFKIYTSC